MRFTVVIPARLSSERLPHKPLAMIGDRPLVLHCLALAREAGAEEVVVAADDASIVERVEAAGGEAALTSPDHPSGTDRIAEVARQRGWGPDRIVVNLQGDEPLIPPELLRALAAALEDNPQAGMATMATPIDDVAMFRSENVVKVVCDGRGFGLYFSRAPIPHARGASLDVVPPGALRHLGLYAYRVRTLARLSETPPTALENIERLEQLRAMSLGIPIHVTTLASAPPHGVDTPEDLERVRAILAP